MKLEYLIDQYNKGKLNLVDLQNHLSLSYIENIGKNIKFDIDRDLRNGIPEIIYGQKKTYSDILKICSIVLNKNNKVLVSKLDTNTIEKIIIYYKKKKLFVERGRNSSTILVSKSRTFRYNKNSKIGVICAGTSDIGIAEEARLVSKIMGCQSITSYDVGIAGIHRLIPVLKKMINKKVKAIVVVAGMEGALPSIVSSCIDLPVIGVPTSVGYGIGGNGIGALYSMLQSCVLGLTVVNIDNGIGAGSFAALIANQIASKQTTKNC
ncbi:MAG: nickel pincer cofactor biosynthesis protein LarB [Nitrososphaeraceae archaeon]